MAEQNKKFQLGRTVATPGAIHEALVLSENEFNEVQVVGTDAEIEEGKNEIFVRLLQKHSKLEQGDLCDEDYQQNLDAVKNEGKKDDNGDLMQNRVFSSYLWGKTKFWIITEWDRSVTTILLPSEY